MQQSEPTKTYGPEQVDQLVSQAIVAVQSANVATVEEAIQRMAASGECYALPSVQASFLYKNQQFRREDVSIFLAEHGEKNPELLRAYFGQFDLSNETLLSCLRRYHHELRLCVPKKDTLANVLLRGLAEKYLKDNPEQSPFDMYVHIKEDEKPTNNGGNENDETALLSASSRRNTVRRLDIEDCVLICQLILTCENGLHYKFVSGRGRMTLQQLSDIWETKHANYLPGYSENTVKNIFDELSAWSLLEKEDTRQKIETFQTPVVTEEKKVNEDEAFYIEMNVKEKERKKNCCCVVL